MDGQVDRMMPGAPREVLHEGRRVFAEKRGLWPTLAWLTGCFVFAFVVLVLSAVGTLVLAVLAAVVLWLVLE